jgi:hypothetical protein
MWFNAISGAFSVFHINDGYATISLNISRTQTSGDFHVSWRWKVELPAIKAHIQIAKMFQLCVWGLVLCEKNVNTIKITKNLCSHLC